jgi:hypothetical protein
MTYTYTEDSYKTYSASALAGIGLIRNLAGAGFPLFGTHMYHRLGKQGATSLLAGLAVLMVPIPFVLARYGESLRKKSKWASGHGEGGSDEEEDVVGRGGGGEREEGGEGYEGSERGGSAGRGDNRRSGSARSAREGKDDHN